MKIHIDLSGQVSQKNYDSSLGCKRIDGVIKSVFLRKTTKKAIIKKYKGQVVNLVEKIHCILIYYCIRDILDDVDELIICRDGNFRRIARLLPLLFSEHKDFFKIKISQRRTGDKKSDGHYPALKTFRKKRYADKMISREMVEEKLFEFKRK